MLDSKKFSLNTNDLWSLAKGALIVGTAAVLTYVAENLAQVDLGPNGVLVVPVVTLVLDTVVKWLKDNKNEQ